jgi:DNA polymerase III, delta subunit
VAEFEEAVVLTGSSALEGGMKHHWLKTRAEAAGRDGHGSTPSAVRAFLLPSPARGRQIPGVSYTVFARKYRPQTFDEVVGQDHIVRTLKNAIAQNRLAQAYLFVGPRGTGKTSSARIFAKALNCINGPTADPCGVCPMCQEIAEGTSLNVMEFDAASNTQVDKIREIIIDNVKYMPTGGAKWQSGAVRSPGSVRAYVQKSVDCRGRER